MGSSPKEKKPRRAESPSARVERADGIFKRLESEYPDARCMLDHANPFELLVATILAAQCTDERVNVVTPPLFRRFPTPQAMASAPMEELEGLVRSTGFFHNKAKAVKGASEALVKDSPSGFPRTMEELLRLPGVGRKTANVVLGTCFGVPAIIVDTHVKRVVQRMSLAESDDPDAIEAALSTVVPAENWTRFSNVVTFHGRRCCRARNPDCPHCAVEPFCPWPSKTEP
jgi:endonuclease-3